MDSDSAALRKTKFVRSYEESSGTAEVASSSWVSSSGTDDPRDNGPQHSGRLSESNIGFQLLRKAGWKEGTGLGVAEQGRLNPVETYLKLDKRGIGAEKRVKRVKKVNTSEESEQNQKKQPKKKGISKAAKRAAAEEAQYQEQAFAREFFREFWPENV